MMCFETQRLFPLALEGINRKVCIEQDRLSDLVNSLNIPYMLELPDYTAECRPHAKRRWQRSMSVLHSLHTYSG